MARCRCTEAICSCALAPGDGTTVSGDGSPQNPYVVNATARSTGTVDVADTATLNLTRTGTGTTSDPYIISGAVVGAGALVTGPGIRGDGSAANPLRIDFSTYGELKTAAAAP